MITDAVFQEWEQEAFGYGYGTGEEHVLGALQTFFKTVGVGQDIPTSYNYERLEVALTPPVAWLLINALCRDGVIEYGTSPRFGWLTAKGEAIKEYVLAKTLDELVEIANSEQSDHV